MYQLNIIKKIKKDYRKKFVKDIKIFLKKENKKGDNMALSIEKNIESEKMLYYIYKKVY